MTVAHPVDSMIEEAEAESLEATMDRLGRQARAAATRLAQVPGEAKADALRAAAAALRADATAILEANARDVAAAEARGQAGAFVDRLTLTPGRVEAMAAGLEQVADLPDPVGATIAEWDRPNGLPDRARARAAGRDRHHLREPAERHRRCRRTVPEGRQRGDPARRVGEFPFLPRDRRRRPTRDRRGWPAGGRASSWCRPPTGPRWASC